MSWAEKAAGIYESSWADFAYGRWVPGMPTTKGRFWAMDVAGLGPTAGFEVPTRKILWAISKENLEYVERVAAGLNIVVTFSVLDDEGERHVITLIGPKGRLRRIFEFIGFPLKKGEITFSGRSSEAWSNSSTTTPPSARWTESASKDTGARGPSSPFSAPYTGMGYIDGPQEPEIFKEPIETECPSCRSFSSVIGVPWECATCGAWVQQVFGEPRENLS